MALLLLTISLIASVTMIFINLKIGVILSLMIGLALFFVIKHHEHINKSEEMNISGYIYGISLSRNRFKSKNVIFVSKKRDIEVDKCLVKRDSKGRIVDIKSDEIIKIEVSGLPKYKYFLSKSKVVDISDDKVHITYVRNIQNNGYTAKKVQMSYGETFEWAL